MRPKRSRMAYFGSNSLNNSGTGEDPQNYLIPTYSAFNGRAASNLLRDFHYQISSMRNSSRGKQRDQDILSPRSAPRDRPSKRQTTEPAPIPDTESVFSEPDILDKVQTITPKMYLQGKKRTNPKSIQRAKRLQSERGRDNSRFDDDDYHPTVSQKDYESKYNAGSMTNDRILLELMNIKQRINLGDQMRMQQPYMYQPPPPVQQQPRSSALQDKMLQMLMKMSLQQQPQQQQQPIVIQSPQVPNYPPPPPPPPPIPQRYPEPQPYRRKQYSPQPLRNQRRPRKQYDQPRREYSPEYPVAPRKNMKYVRRRLKKIFWAVAFPFLLKKYYKKLVLVRKQYMINNLASILIDSTNLIKQWFIKSSSRAISMLSSTYKTSLEYYKEQDESVCEDHMKKISMLVDMILNSLEDTSKIQVTRQFLPFISVTCDNRSFIHENFVTNKQLQYISFSKQHKYQFLDSNLQLVQIILFVIIKVIVYDILFQPGRVEETWNKQPLVGNLKLLGYVIYHCTEELLNDKLKNVKPKGYTSVDKDGVSLEQEKRKVQENLTWDKLTFLDGIKSKKCVEKIKTYMNGDYWRSWKKQIEKIGTKLHREMVNKRSVVDKVFKQLEVKFNKAAYLESIKQRQIYLQQKETKNNNK